MIHYSNNSKTPIFRDIWFKVLNKSVLKENLSYNEIEQPLPIVINTYVGLISSMTVSLKS